MGIDVTTYLAVGYPIKNVYGDGLWEFRESYESNPDFEVIFNEDEEGFAGIVIARVDGKVPGEPYLQELDPDEMSEAANRVINEFGSMDAFAGKRPQILLFTWVC